MDSPVSGYVNFSHEPIGYNWSELGLDEQDIERFMADYYNLSGTDQSTQHTRYLITYYMMGIGAMTICVLGLLGNIFSLIVLTQKTMLLSTYSYLSSIAVCDSLVLISTMVLLMKDLDYPVKDQPKWPWDRGLYPYLFPYVHPLAFTFQVTSIWLTLAFTIDRYIMICHPFHAEPFCNIGVARKVIFVIYIIGMLFNIPKFFEYETVTIPIPMRNETRVGCDLTSFGRDHVFRKLYHSWFYITFVCGIPFIFLAVLNVCLMHAVQMSRRRGKEINAMERKRNDTTIMLIGVVVIFFLCQTPALVSRVVWAFEKDTKAFKRLPLYTLNETGNFLIILNSAVNFVPYYFFGQRFRRQFWAIFCQCVLRHKNGLSHSYSLTVLDTQRTSIGSMQVIKLNSIITSHPSISSGRSSHCCGNSSTSGTTYERSGSTLRAGSDLSMPAGQFLDVKGRLSATDCTEDMNASNGSESSNFIKDGLAEILQVGVTVFRYVSHEHARPWLIYSLKNVKGRGITDLSDVSEGDDVLELPVGLELPGYFPAKEKSASQAAVATTGDTPVSNASEAGTSQTVSTEDPASGVTHLGMSDPAMKRQLSETSPGGTPPHKRQHLDTVTSFGQNKDVLQDLSQVSPVEMQTTQSNEAVEVKGQRSIPTVGVTSNKSQLKSPTSVQHLVTQELSVRCKAVTLAATVVTVTNNRSQAAAKIPVARSPVPVMLPATSVTRSLTAVKIPATSVTTSPAAVNIQATPVTRSPAAVKIQATPVARAQAAVKIQATSVARSPAAVKLPATPVARSPASVKIQATSVARSPAAVKLPATPVARSPAAVKLPATTVARTQATVKIPATSVPSQEMTLDPSILDAITKSGIRGPFRLQLPANLKLPTAGSGQKIRFSVMTKAEAAKLGLGCTMAGILPPHQPQVTTSQSMTGQTPTKTTMPPPAASSSTVVTLPSVQMTHPSKSSSKHPAGGSSVPPFKTKLVTKGSDHKDGNIPQLDGIADDLVDVKESRQTAFSVDDKLTASSSQAVVDVYGVSHMDGPLFGDTSLIPQLDGTVDGETPNTSNKGDSVNTQSDDVTTQSGDITTQSDDVTTQSGDVTTKSDDVTSREEHHGADKMTQSERPNRPKHPVKLNLGRPDTKSNYRKVRLVARPWKTPEGTVNRPTLKMMLEAVMMFIMTKPGVTKADLAAKYNPLLQPVLLMELTQMLQELGCVKQYIVGRSHKTSVFAPRATLSQVAMDTGEETVTYIPTVDCIIKLGQFEAQLSK